MSIEEIYFGIEASINVKKEILNDKKLVLQLLTLSKDCIECLKKGGKVIFAGNGGSFADAQHISAEFISRFMFDRPPLSSVVLGANNSAITAVGNDYGYHQVFARELLGIAKKEDIFIPISTSGNSPNIIAAVTVAKELGIKTLGLTGMSGGNLKINCESICVPSNITARIQECHIMLGHILCGLVETGFFSSK